MDHARRPVHLRSRRQDRQLGRVRALRRQGRTRHTGHRTVSSRSRTRGLPQPLRREKNTGAHCVHLEDRQAAEELGVTMKEVIIASAVRTAVGKAPRGTLRTTRPDDLAAFAINGALDRVPQLDKSEIEDVIIGCAMPEAEQGMNVARVASFRAGLPITVSGMTINRYCASGLQSIALAAERIRGGGADVIVAGGTESMSYVPFGGNKISVNPWLVENYPGAYMSMGLTAERVATHYGITREQMDQFSYESHQKALAAIQSGKFEDEIVPVTVTKTTIDERGKA